MDVITLASHTTADKRRTPPLPGHHHDQTAASRSSSRKLAINTTPSHAALARRLHAYLRWRNANARDPRVLDAQRRERARVRSEKGHRWGRPQPRAA